MNKVIIIDDEPLARSVLKNYLHQVTDLHVVEECSNGFEGAKAIDQHKPDLIFLDIQMPKINGFEMLEIVDHRPAVIFTTAFDEYALKAFDNHAVDYLLKPFSEERFNIALDKWKNNQSPLIANSHFFSFPSHIDTVAKAITIIGTEEFRQLVLATSVIKLFSELPNELVSMETFWRHSLRCAMIARSLASHLHEPNPEHYFTSGLMHDIGYLIIYRELPELAAKTLKHSTQNREIVYIVEQEIIGFQFFLNDLFFFNFSGVCLNSLPFLECMLNL